MHERRVSPKAKFSNNSQGNWKKIPQQLYPNKNNNVKSTNLVKNHLFLKSFKNSKIPFVKSLCFQKYSALFNLDLTMSIYKRSFLSYTYMHIYEERNNTVKSDKRTDVGSHKSVMEVKRSWMKCFGYGGGLSVNLAASCLPDNLPAQVFFALTP